MIKLLALNRNRYSLAVVIISLTVAVLIHFPELISLMDSQVVATPFAGIQTVDALSEIVFLFFLLLFIFWLNTAIFHYNRAKVEITWWKLTLTFLLTWLVNNVTSHGFVTLHQHLGLPAIDATIHHYLHPLRDFIISCLVTGSCYIIHLIFKQQHILVENQQLRTEGLRNQYESLKSQLNPHMLFNSLNTLRSLIREAPDKAQEYTQGLSNVLRYTLQSNESKCVPLSQELEFTHSYMFLLKMRYEENLHFDIDIDNQLLSYLLPPMSLQLLIENAVKHNQISNRHPLTITIRTLGDNSITVSNPIIRKLTPYVGTKIGLQNLSRRYELLMHQSIVIDSIHEIFSVKLPMIHSEKYKALNQEP